MYIPAEYEINDPDLRFDFMNEHNFAILVSGGAEGHQATHMPFVLKREPKPLGRLIAHMARENPQWKTFEDGKEVLTIFHGPHAYISPSWYRVSRTVPTWNYTAVHAYGVPRLITERGEVWRSLLELIARHEGRIGSGWQLSDVPRAYLESLIEKIVAFEISLSRIEGKFKLSQDKPEEDRANVIRMLESSAAPDERLVAQMMRSSGPKNYGVDEGT